MWGVQLQGSRLGSATRRVPKPAPWRTRTVRAHDNGWCASGRSPMVQPPDSRTKTGEDASNRDKSRERMNGAQALHSAGQSLWLDSISRTMLRSGARRAMCPSSP